MKRKTQTNKTQTYSYYMRTPNTHNCE